MLTSQTVYLKWQNLAYSHTISMTGIQCNLIVEDESVLPLELYDEAAANQAYTYTKTYKLNQQFDMNTANIN